MIRDAISLMGIPVDNVTTSEALDRIFGMTAAFKNDNTPRYVATVNVDFIVNTLSWRTDHSRHPELLDILRRADLVTADGMPVVWASKIMNSPLKERISGSDMIPELAERSVKLGKSLFLFGGAPGLAEEAADKLMSRYPGLRIAGTYSPDIATEGEAILDSAEEDRELIKKINESGADILLIGLGNPKQEIWFERNRNALNVPVSIGVGGSFGFITGSVARAPEWMQKNGLEWIYRIYQDPGRLWKRYFNGFFKFGACILFPLIFHKIGRTIIQFQQHGKELKKEIEINVRSRERTVKLNMPYEVTRESVKGIKDLIPLFKESFLIIDFKNTMHMDLYAMGFLANAWKHSMSRKSPLYLTGANPFLTRLLKYNRLWDILGKLQHDKLDEKLIDENKVSNDNSSFHYTTDSDEDSFRIELHGRLDAANISKLDIPELIKIIGAKNCIVNLRNLKFIDSTGLIFFLKIKKHLSIHNKIPVMCNANEDILQIFNITKLLDLFKIIPDFDNKNSLVREGI